ncbi:ABC-type amino acid transport/signal transduction systems, periplasmic component/domain [Desulfovibrio ferrophilus]|uniref:ABC-type amino acid transport/signal transduction systems, periplasmic component/domain n=2 Tax=Desulfovibrio ferrophilus TaxID=241368 RepID=A0A2Z6AZ97_9BACT|nr:ABC-type amino acid transport/signal transduction systems, periplasmic component/domain [Desulfovibrio ferrophilus]
MMKDGQVDLITNFALTKERLEFSHYIMPPYAIQQTVLYVQKGNKDLIRSYPDINKSIIGTVKGAHIFERLHIDPQIQCVEVTQQTQLLEMLKNNRVSAILGIETNLNYQIITEGYSGMFERAAYTPPDAYGVHFAISKHSRHNNLEPQIERELTNLLQEGEVSRVIDNYIRE